MLENILLELIELLKFWLLKFWLLKDELFFVIIAVLHNSVSPIISYDISFLQEEKLKLSIFVFIVVDCKSFNEHFKCNIILGLTSLLSFNDTTCCIIFPPFGFLPRFLGTGFSSIIEFSVVVIISLIKLFESLFSSLGLSSMAQVILLRLFFSLLRLITPS